jgi:ubiquinone/menaquinone biosynthesis C-methylase UbiE
MPLRPSRDETHAARAVESDLWHAAYANPAAIGRRRGAMPAKLRRLGMDCAPRDAAILDLCCGHGEALECLYERGFRRLHGLDLRIDDGLAADSRFQTQAADALTPPYPDATFDWIVNIHAMHHLASAERVSRMLDECWRLLRPGGRLGIIDFPASPQVCLAFWFFRQNRFLWTPYLKTFGRMVQEEWSFLKDYLPQWPHVRSLLWDGRLRVEQCHRGLFYFYLTLRKPE